ncbi:MAG: leucine-rich repeat domain-containing protein [Clostridiales bacterium]|nr:leucine-rich repeat domain-containing protein [Clostridiales bacterium]
MNKSGKIKFCFLSLPLILAAVAAVGCGEEEHTHAYSSDWAFNQTAHWHPSTCSHDAKANKSEHTYTDTVIAPSTTSEGYTLHTCICGYSYTSNSVGALPPESGELRYDENGHWNAVLTGEQVTVKAHEYTDTVIEPTCSTYGYTKHTCACGYWYASGTTNPIPHTYDEDVWGHDENGHWHAALCCNAKIGVTAHNYTENVIPAAGDDHGYTEYTCADCGYSYQVLAGHSYSDTLTGDEYSHWRPATCAHSTERADVAEHVLVGVDNVCKVCNMTVTPRLAYQLSADGEYYIVTGKGGIRESAIVIPDTYREKEVREVSARAFKNADITSVTFGANVKKIGIEAFANSQIAAEISLSGIEEIGARAFAGTKVTSVTLGASLEKLGYSVFRDCAELATAEIQSGLTILPPYTFESCSSLESVTLAHNLTEIGAQAFLDCVQLGTLDLSACTKVGFAAFGGCSEFVPANLNSLSLAEEYAFSGCAIETVTLPATLTMIGDNLFNGCEALQSVTLTATGIGKSAFEGCVSLSEVTLNNVQLIGASAFKGCSSLNSLDLPNSVIRVSENAFEGTGLITTVSGIKYAANVVIGAESSVTSATLAAGTVGIADGAFRENGNLQTVALGDVRFIGVSAFRECTKLTGVTFTPSVKYISANSFRESGLTSVTVPDTVLSIGDNAFYDCKALISATVNAQEIGRFAFSYTGANRTLNSPVKVRPSYAKLETLTLGAGVQVIGSNAFQYAPIKNITLPDGVTSIGKYAFAQTDFTSINIPASVTRIGEYAFYESKITAATFADTQGWKTSKTSLSLGTDAQNATYLKTTYLDIDWVKE